MQSKNKKTYNNMETSVYNEVFAKVAKQIKRNADGSKYVKQVMVEEKPKGICPYMQFVRLDALNKEDYPHGIDMNSVYICFCVNHKENKVEVHSFGHVYLNEADKQSEKYKYYAMKSIQDVYVDEGGKKFRKSKFKTEKDLCKKMFDYFDNVMVEVEKYTGGYPYKA